MYLWSLVNVMLVCWFWIFYSTNSYLQSTLLLITSTNYVAKHVTVAYCVYRMRDYIFRENPDVWQFKNTWHVSGALRSCVLSLVYHAWDYSCKKIMSINKWNEGSIFSSFCEVRRCVTLNFSMIFPWSYPGNLSLWSLEGYAHSNHARSPILYACSKQLSG